MNEPFFSLSLSLSLSHIELRFPDIFSALGYPVTRLLRKDFQYIYK